MGIYNIRFSSTLGFSGYQTSSKGQVVYAASFPFTMTIDRVQIYSTVVQGTCPTYRVSLQSLTSGMYASGTILSSGNAYKNTQFTANSLNTVMLNSSYSASPGDSFAVVIDWPNAGGTTPDFNNYAAAFLQMNYFSAYQSGKKYHGYNLATPTVNSAPTTGVPMMCASDGTTIAGMLMDGTTYSTSNVKKVAVDWVCPAELDGYIFKGWGCYDAYITAVAGTIDYSADTFRAVCWDTSYNELAASGNYPTYAIPSNNLPYIFSTPITLVAGTTYVIGWEISSSTGYIKAPYFNHYSDIGTLSTFLEPGLGGLTCGARWHNGTSWTTYSNVIQNGTNYCIQFLVVDPPATRSFSMRGGFQN